MKVWVVVTAAGSSRRMGGVNKLLLSFKGRPVLASSLAYFQAQDAVAGIFVTASAAQIPEYQDLIRQFHFDKVRQVVEGGAERQDSIRNALRILPAEPQDVVAIHDGARPNLAPDLLERLCRALQGADGSLPMVAVKDTVKRLDARGKVIETLRRDELFAAQTPQVFPFGVIYQAHMRAHQEGFLGTDDCSLVERYGGCVVKVEGDYDNLKVTTPEDLAMLEATGGPL